MKNRDRWLPTKVVRTPTGFEPSSDLRHLGRGSRFIAALQLERYSTLLRAHASGRLLDLGCGQVPYLDLYERQVSECVCVDWEKSAKPSQFADTLVDLNGPLPFESEGFDTVLLTDVLEHIAEPQQLMREVARVLRRGGKALVTVPFLYWLHEEPHDYHRFTEHALRRMCDRSGLEVLSLDPYGGAPDVLVDVSGKIVAGSRLLSSLHTTAWRLLRGTRGFRRLSARTSRSFPLGYCLAALRP